MSITHAVQVVAEREDAFPRTHMFEEHEPGDAEVFADDAFVQAQQGRTILGIVDRLGDLQQGLQLELLQFQSLDDALQPGHAISRSAS
ncbi:MAG: hypothetical protein IPH63_10715 [Flavobacteriales bacterium]|nr:hypothetical protein [Flavobacteriales bacterium]